MKKAMNYILIILLVLGLSGCSKNVIKDLEINNNECKIEQEIDTHGGFLGDGEYFAKIKCKDIKPDQLSSNWKKVPTSDNVKELLDMDQCDEDSCKNFYERYNVPDITNGYYLLKDRHSETKDTYDDTNINNRASWNVTLVLLDNNTNTIYYYRLDT